MDKGGGKVTVLFDGRVGGIAASGIIFVRIFVRMFVRILYEYWLVEVFLDGNVGL